MLIWFGLVLKIENVYMRLRKLFSLNNFSVIKSNLQKKKNTPGCFPTTLNQKSRQTSDLTDLAH